MAGTKAVGVDLGGTFIKFGLVSRDGVILKRGRIDSNCGQGRDAVLRQMEFAAYEAMNGTEKSEICGIGIGTPGLVDNEGRVFQAPNLPQWDDLPLADIFRNKFNLPVKVENDVNTITWGEYVFGSGKGCGTIICITLGTGLGGGVVLNGKLLRGGRFSAVELGHITINAKGPRCGCGNRGCVESYVASGKIVARTKRYLKRGIKSVIPDLVHGDLSRITPKIISEAWSQGDALAARIWQETGAYVGVMLASAVNIFNPDAIVIGGGISHAGKPLFDAIEREIKQRSFSMLVAGLKILPASLGAESGILAAAALAF